VRTLRKAKFLGSLALCICLSAAGAIGQASGHTLDTRQAAPQTGEKDATIVGRAIPDVSVIDQDGNPRRFYTDLVKGRVVVINFIYTTCTTICPPLGATFGKLQKGLGDRLGKEVFLISISVDPATDTPARLRAWGAQFGAAHGWTLITGDKSELNRLLRVLGTDVASPENHSAMVLIVNDRAGTWKRVYGLGSIAVLMRSVQQMLPASVGTAPQADGTVPMERTKNR
jgi:protein SCO1/2